MAVAQLLNRTRRGGGNLHPGNQPGHPRVLGRAVDGGDGFAQQQGLAAAGDHRERIEASGLLWHRL